MIVALLACKAPVPTPPVPTGQWEHPLAELFRAGLPGFEIREGRQLPFEDCDQVVGEIGTCLGNNTATPYTSVFFEEDGYGEAFGMLQLERDDAVVFVGRTPPSSRYFSLQAAVHERLYTDGWDTPVGSIAQSLNHRNIQHGGPANNPFEQLTAIIATGSPRTANSLRQALEPVASQHAEADILNVIELPMLDEGELALVRADPAYDGEWTTLLRPGSHEGADRFSFAWRVAGADPDAAFFDPERLEGAVFKVSPTSHEPEAPWPWPHLPPQRDSTNGPGADAAAALELLAETVAEESRVLGLQATVAPFAEADFHGFRCVEQGIRCGNSDDAWYAGSAPVQLPLELENAGVTAVGFVHSLVLTGPPLAYANLDLLDNEARASVDGWLDDALTGTARARFPDGIPGLLDIYLDAMFVMEVSRHCVRPGCIEVDGDTVPGDHDLNLLERAYLDLSTNTGPHRASILQSQLVVWGPEVVYLPAQRRFEVR